MNGQNLKKESETDWEKVDALTDEEIDTSDIPECDDEFFATAELRMPKDKHTVLLSVDEETYEGLLNKAPISALG